MNADGTSAITRFRAAVGENQVLVDEDEVAGYCTDWSRRWSGSCLCVVRPGSTEEVATIVRICSELAIPILPQGGNTGLVGGSVPAGDAGAVSPPVILSLRRINWIGDVDQLSGQLSAGAGALLGDVQRAANRAGWRYGVDLAARESATLGGTVATNAGGINVIAYGMTRAQVVGVQAVMSDGTVLDHMAGMLKDNTGYDLASLLCGSEGTLAVITAVRVRLHPRAPKTTVGLIGVGSYADALELMSSARVSTYDVLAAEVVDKAGIERVMSVSDRGWPLADTWPVGVILELVDGGDGDGFVEILPESADAIIAMTASDAAGIWEYRERQSEAYSVLGVAHKLDVSVPLQSLAACADELHRVVAGFPEVSAFGIFGHLADGNVHVQIVGPEPDDLAVDHAVLDCVARFGGSISAEHGVGRAKVDVLHLSRSNVDITAMRRIKSALDPQNLLNPGVILGDEPSHHADRLESP